MAWWLPNGEMPTQVQPALLPQELAELADCIAGPKQINLDDTLEKLGIDDKKPSLTFEETQATVRDLLEARSESTTPPLRDKGW